MKKGILVFFGVAWLCAFAGGQGLTVKSPNNMEKWGIGSRHHITWTAANIVGPQRVVLMQSNQKVGDIAVNLHSSLRFFNWEVGTLHGGSIVPLGRYKIRVIDEGSGVSDDSDTDFEICPPMKYRIILPSSPVWVVGGGYTIKWVKTEEGGFADHMIVKISLIRRYSDDVVMTIAQKASNTGSFTWVVPNSVPLAEYRIMVSSGSGAGSRWGHSEGFIIQPKIRFKKPVSEEKWFYGVRHEIIWSVEGPPVGNTRIDLLDESGQKWIRMIYVAAAGVNSFKWLVTDDVSQGRYRIRLSMAAADNPSGIKATAVSPVFSISAMPTFAAFRRLGEEEEKAITVTSPKGGETWRKGQTYEITWEKKGQLKPLVTIRLDRHDRTYYMIIVSNTDNDGSYNWNVFHTVQDGAYCIRVYQDSQVFGYSGVIQIGK